MTVKVETLDNFLGVVQSRDYRKPECSGYGENSRITYLRINMLAQSSEKEYCGVFISQVIIIDCLERLIDLIWHENVGYIQLLLIFAISLDRFRLAKSIIKRHVI